FAKKTAIVLSRLTHFTREPLSAAVMGALLSLVFLSGCAEEDRGIVVVCVPPTVIRTSPADGGVDVPLTKAGAAAAPAVIAAVKVISATFSTPMNPRTITAATFLMRQGADTIR